MEYPRQTIDAGVHRHGTRMLKQRGLTLLRGNETRLDEEDPTPEGETHMPCKRGNGGDMQQRRECDRVFGYQYARIVDQRHGSPLVWSTSGGKPREVAMGVGMVMTGMRRAGVLIPVILLVMHVCGVVVIVEVGWTRMGEEHPMPLSARTVVNDHMQSRHEKGNHQTQAYHAHTRHRLVLGSPTLQEKVSPIAPRCPPYPCKESMHAGFRSRYGWVCTDHSSCLCSAIR